MNDAIEVYLKLFLITLYIILNLYLIINKWYITHFLFYDSDSKVFYFFINGVYLYNVDDFVKDGVY